MQLGEEKTRIEIDGVTLVVVLPWGKQKALLRAVAALDETDPATLEAVEAQVRGCIVAVSGLTNEDGAPVLTMTAEVWDALPGTFVAEVVRRLSDIGGQVDEATFQDAEPTTDGGPELPVVGGGVDAGPSI